MLWLTEQEKIDAYQWKYVEWKPGSKILRHYYDFLPESERDKDFQPFNCMLRLIRRFDGLRIYRFASEL